MVVLERLARAAAATKWYVLFNPAQVEEIAGGLSPGSSVSFYFDGRLAIAPYGSDVARIVLKIAGGERDAVVGRIVPGSPKVEVQFIANQEELDDFVNHLIPTALLRYGSFPARDNDGDRAITLDMPDADGIVRSHPH